MEDTTKTEVIKLVSNSDTVSYSVDKKIINHFTKEKSVETVQILAIVLPILASLLTLMIVRWFDNISESKKHKREIAKESRKERKDFLKYLNKLDTDIRKSNNPETTSDDFPEWTANNMVGKNPFESLKLNGNVYFNEKEINSLIDKLYDNAETINRLFDWNTKTHGENCVNLGATILSEIGDLRKLISNNLNIE